MVVKFYLVLRLYFFLGLFLLPLVFWPWSAVPYEIPRVWFVWRWLEGLGVLALVFTPFTLKKRKIDSFLVIMVCSFILLAFLSSFLGVDLEKSFWGNYYRQDGLLTLSHLVGLVFFLVLFWENSWWRPTIVALTLGSFSTALWAISSAIKHWGFPVAVSFGNPNFLAGYLLVCLPFTAYLVSKSITKKGGVFWWVVLCCQAIALFLTLSMGGILGLLFFCLSWLSLNKSNVLKRWFGFSLLGIVLFSALLSALVFYQRDQPDKRKVFLPESRERIFIKGILAFETKPIIGWGWANFDHAFEATPWPFKVRFDVYVDKAHSGLLEVLVTTGILGLIAYLGIILRVLWRLYRQKQKILILVFLLFLFHSQTNVISVAEELVFWLIIGITANGDFST